MNTCCFLASILIWNVLRMVSYAIQTIHERLIYRVFKQQVVHNFIYRIRWKWLHMLKITFNTCSHTLPRTLRQLYAQRPHANSFIVFVYANVYDVIKFCLFFLCAINHSREWFILWFEEPLRTIVSTHSHLCLLYVRCIHIKIVI